MPHPELTSAELRALAQYKLTILARRTEDRDLDKRPCEFCEKLLVRHVGERMQNWRRRRTCDRRCSRGAQFRREGVDVSSYEDLRISCAECAWMREDSDIGEHCGKCDSGSKYRRKR